MSPGTRMTLAKKNGARLFRPADDRVFGYFSLFTAGATIISVVCIFALNVFGGSHQETENSGAGKPNVSSTERAVPTRRIEYLGKEQSIAIEPEKATMLIFSSSITGGLKQKGSSLRLKRQANLLEVIAGTNLPFEGEALVVQLQDGGSIVLRIQRTVKDLPRDERVEIVDKRVADEAVWPFLETKIAESAKGGTNPLPPASPIVPDVGK